MEKCFVWKLLFVTILGVQTISVLSQDSCDDIDPPPALNCTCQMVTDPRSSFENKLVLMTFQVSPDCIDTVWRPTPCTADFIGECRRDPANPEIHKIGNKRVGRVRYRAGVKRCLLDPDDYNCCGVTDEMRACTLYRCFGPTDSGWSPWSETGCSF